MKTAQLVNGETLCTYELSGKRLNHVAEQRTHFMDELRFFMDKSKVEQRLRLNEHVTSSEEFWNYRLGSSAVGVVLCLNASVLLPQAAFLRVTYRLDQILQRSRSPGPCYTRRGYGYTVGPDKHQHLQVRLTRSTVYFHVVPSTITQTSHQISKDPHKPKPPLYSPQLTNIPPYLLASTTSSPPRRNSSATPPPIPSPPPLLY